MTLSTPGSRSGYRLSGATLARRSMNLVAIVANDCASPGASGDLLVNRDQCLAGFVFQLTGCTAEAEPIRGLHHEEDVLMPTLRTMNGDRAFAGQIAARSRVHTIRVSIKGTFSHQDTILSFSNPGEDSPESA